MRYYTTSPRSVHFAIVTPEDAARDRDRARQRGSIWGVLLPIGVAGLLGIGAIMWMDRRR